MNQLSNAGHGSVFENVKNVNGNGVEYWLARDFQTILQYSSWDKFLNVVEKAKEACHNSGHNPADHFSHVVKMVSIGSGAQRETDVQNLHQLHRRWQLLRQIHRCSSIQSGLQYRHHYLPKPDMNCQYVDM